MISVKFYLDVSRWHRAKWGRNIAENFNRLSRVHERYRQTDRQTDRRAMTYSEREGELTFANKNGASQSYLFIYSFKM